MMTWNIPNAKFSLCTVKKPHSPVDVHVLSGHRYDLLADIKIQEITELNNKAIVYSNRVPNEEEPTTLNNLDSIFEQHPPRHEAKNELPMVIGSDIIEPISFFMSFYIL